jgi:aspartyl aminopeptidase
MALDADALPALVGRCPTAYHFVQVARELLAARGFAELDIRARWEAIPAKFFTVRDRRTVCAFAIADKSHGVIFTAPSGTAEIAAKPVPADAPAGRLLGVFPLGQPVSLTWFDRDLRIAGRAITADRQIRLFETPTPVCVIPSTARAVDAQFPGNFNADKHLLPVLSSSQNCGLLSIIAEQLKCAPEEIAGFDAVLVDSNPPALVGTEREFLAGQNADSLTAAFAALFAFLDEGEPTEGFRCFAAFHSSMLRSWLPLDLAGPLSNTLPALLGRIGVDAVALEKSILIGVENRRGRSPTEPPQPGTPPVGKWTPGDGVVHLRTQSRGMVTSLAAETAICRVAKRIGVRLNPIGATEMALDPPGVGSWSSTNLGVRAAAVGVPVWGVATIRPVVAVSDVIGLYELLRGLLSDWPGVGVIENA